MPKNQRRDDPWAHPIIKQQLAKRSLESVADAERYDSYKNELTGIGDWMRDKTFGGNSAGAAFIVRYINGQAAEDRWRGSDLGGRVIETIPHEMVRQGWEVNIQPGKDEDEKDAEQPGVQMDAFPAPGGAAAPPQGMPMQKPPMGALPEIDDESMETEEELEGKLEELNASNEIWQALCYERAYGGSAILIGADDGQVDLAKPLDEKRISSINWLNTFQGGIDGEIVAWSYYRDPREPNYGMPETYMMRNIGVPIARIPAPGEPFTADIMPLDKTGTGYGPLVFWVHESRLLLFPGTTVSRRARVQQRGWGDSIFTRIDDILSHYGQTWAGIANLMQDFSQGVLKIEGLAAMLAGGNKASKGAPLTNRALQLNMARSISRLLLIDSNEEFSRETASLAGISDIMQQMALRLAAAVDMPVTLLMGQAPAGLNATGASDIRFFYDRVTSMQKKRLQPQLKKLIRLIMLSKEGPCKGTEPERWDISFNPLYQMTELENAQLRYQVAQTDQIYINTQVLSPEEVTASAFGGSEWTMERTVDFDGRAEMIAQDEKDKSAKEKLMSESAKVGLPPEQLNLKHPEHPANAPQPEPPAPVKKDEEPSKEDKLDTMARALDTMRKAGAVVDIEKLKERFPELPVKRIIEDNE